MRKTLGNIENDYTKKYITTPEDALRHLNSISKTYKDRRALTVLAKYIDMQNDQDKAQNWLFAKLWLYIFDRNLVAFKNGNAALQSIKSALEMSMDFYFDQINMSVQHFTEYNEIDKLTEEGEIGKATEKILSLTNNSRDMLIDKINLMLNDKNFYE